MLKKLSKQCISITELKKNASVYIKTLRDGGDKVVFVNNKPKAVLVDLERFEFLQDQWETLFDFEKEDINQDEFMSYLTQSLHDQEVAKEN